MRRRERGFALVEALAALVVSAIAAAGLLGALSAARDRSDEAAIRDLALRQARHLLMENASGPDAEVAGQSEGGRLVWTRRVSPVETSASLEAVVVEVAWTSRRRSGTTRLERYVFARP